MAPYHNPPLIRPGFAPAFGTAEGGCGEIDGPVPTSLSMSTSIIATGERTRVLIK
jgi:hypothetical protein